MNPTKTSSKDFLFVKAQPRKGSERYQQTPELEGKLVLKVEP